MTLAFEGIALQTIDTLQAENICMQFGGLTALKNVNFKILPGETVGFIGPNGAGKTTVFNVLSGVYKPTRGKVTLGGKLISQLNPHKVCGLGISRTFQNIRLFSKQTVEENIDAGLVWKNYSGFSFFRPQRTKIDQENMERVLHFLELNEVRNCLATSLPYGLQRKVEIGRALMTRPQVLLLDEPAAGMNPTEKDALAKLVKQVANLGVTLVIIEHDMKFVMNLCERIYVLDHGEQIFEGAPAEVQKSPTVIEAYLGQEDEGIANE